MGCLPWVGQRGDSRIKPANPGARLPAGSQPLTRVTMHGQVDVCYRNFCLDGLRSPTQSHEVALARLQALGKQHISALAETQAQLLIAQKASGHDRITFASQLACERDCISAWRERCAEANRQLTSANTQLAAAEGLNKRAASEREDHDTRVADLQQQLAQLQGRCEEEARAGQRERERADKAEEALCDIQRQLRRAPKDNADQAWAADFDAKEQQQLTGAIEAGAGSLADSVQLFDASSEKLKKHLEDARDASLKQAQAGAQQEQEQILANNIRPYENRLAAQLAEVHGQELALSESISHLQKQTERLETTACENPFEHQVDLDTQSHKENHPPPTPQSPASSPCSQGSQQLPPLNGASPPPADLMSGRHSAPGQASAESCSAGHSSSVSQPQGHELSQENVGTAAASLKAGNEAPVPAVRQECEEPVSAHLETCYPFKILNFKVAHSSISTEDVVLDGLTLEHAAAEEPPVADSPPAVSSEVVSPQAHAIEEQGSNICDGWAVDTWDRCAVGNWEAGPYASSKAGMDAHADLMTVHHVASVLEADFPPGFPKPALGLGPCQQWPPGLGGQNKQGTLSALLHPPPGLKDQPQQEALPALPHPPPALVDPQQQPAAAAVGQPQPDPTAAGQPVRQKKPELDGDWFYKHKVALPRLTWHRIHSNATFDWVNGGWNDEQERLQEEREARLRQQDRESWGKHDKWDHSGFVEIWGDGASANPGPEGAPASPPAEHAALFDDTWGNGAPAIAGPVAARASLAAEHADQLEDAWGAEAPPIPGPEAVPAFLSAGHAGTALLPDDAAAEQVAGSAGEASAAARRWGRSRQSARTGHRQGNSCQAGSATPSQLPNGPRLLPGHAQQGQNARQSTSSQDARLGSDSWTQQEHVGTGRPRHAVQQSPHLQALSRTRGGHR